MTGRRPDRVPSHSRKIQCQTPRCGVMGEVTDVAFSPPTAGFELFTLFSFEEALYDSSILKVQAHIFLERKARVFARVPYHTRHAFARTMGCPARHPKAFWNWSKLLTEPLTRNSEGECGLVCTCKRHA
jgi:hypothetical protein